MREAANGKRLQFAVHVILHAANGWLGIIQQKISSAAVAVIGQTYAAGVDDGDSLHGSNKRQMNVSVNGDWLAERRINRLQFGIGGLRRRSYPQITGTGMHQRYGWMNQDARQSTQQGNTP